MLHHTVHFWLKPDVTDDRKASMIAGLKNLANSPNVTSTWVGTPAGTPRDIVDNSYAIQLMAVFADQAAQAAYQSEDCLLYTSPSPRDQRGSRMPSSA